MGLKEMMDLATRLGVWDLGFPVKREDLARITVELVKKGKRPEMSSLRCRVSAREQRRRQ